MRILVVCQHYWPEPFNSTDVCEELVSRGHDVTVLTGLPNAGMPGNDTLPDYRKNRSLWVEERNGVKIRRSWLHPRKTGAANRILNYLSFWRSANKLSLKLDDSFDVVFGYQFSPVMQVDAGLKYAKKNNVPFLLYSFDLWPESLVAGGIGRASLPFKWIKSESKRIYSSADTLATTSLGFFSYFQEELGVIPTRGVYLPQYAEDLFGESVASTPEMNALFPEGEVHLMFAGNIGKAQSVETIIDAAILLRDEEIRFHIVGSGSSLNNCENICKENQLSNITFHGRHELGEMPKFYAKADAMLATLAGSSMIAYTLPRKVQTYLAASKPIIGALEGEGRRVVNEASCGFCSDVGDAHGLANACREFLQLSKADRVGLGRNARKYYEQHFSKKLFFDTLELELESLKGAKHGV